MDKGEHAFFQPIGLENVVIYLPFLADRWSFKSRIPLYTLMKEDFIAKCSIYQIPACSINLKTFQFRSSSQMWALFYLTALLDCNCQRVWGTSWSLEKGKISESLLHGVTVGFLPSGGSGSMAHACVLQCFPSCHPFYSQLSTESCESQYT